MEGEVFSGDRRKGVIFKTKHPLPDQCLIFQCEVFGNYSKQMKKSISMVVNDCMNKLPVTIALKVTSILTSSPDKEQKSSSEGEIIFGDSGGMWKL